MNADNLPPEEGAVASDTNTDDEIEGAEASTPPIGNESVPSAEPFEGEIPPPPPGPPPGVPSGPRVFPQHFSLLFGAAAIFVGAASVWERTPVFPAEIRGTEMISGAFLLAFAGYCLIVGALNVMTGRLQGMLASFVAGLSALYFGISGLWRTLSATRVWDANKQIIADGFRQMDDLKEIMREDRILQATQESAETGVQALFTEPSFQDGVNAWISQIAPGVWLTLLGGVIIFLVFLKAIFGGKKKDPAPSPSTRRRGRR